MLEHLEKHDYFWGGILGLINTM